MIQGSTIHLVGVFIGALALLTLALAVFLPYASGPQRIRASDDDEKKLSSLAAKIPISEVRDNLIVRERLLLCRMGMQRSRHTICIGRAP
jgi:hypothetical protein